MKQDTASSFLEKTFKTDDDYEILSFKLYQFISIFLIKLPLHLTLGSIPAIQIVVFQDLINVQHPSNSNLLRQSIGSIVNFDALDPEWTTKYILKFEYDEKLAELMEKKKNTILNEQMKVSGYETYNSILNSGGIFMIVLFFIQMVVVSVFVKISIQLFKIRSESKSEYEDVSDNEDSQREGG